MTPLRARTMILRSAWAMLLFLALRFVTRDALRYFTLDEAIFGRLWPNRIWLLAHIAGGMVALLGGPLQFWPGLRRRSLRMHRWMGRAYLVGAMIAATSAIYLTMFIPPSDGGWPASVALATLASAWITASSMALVSIRKGLVTLHKEWMIRSYVLTFAFVNLRWLATFPLISSAGSSTERIITVSWLGWAVPLFVTEVVLQWTRMHRESLALARSSI